MDEATLKKLRLLPVLAALVVVFWLWWWLAAPSPTRLVFTTGSPDGLYHRLAVQLKGAVEANNPDIQIELRTSAGSRANVARLDDREAQLALVQNDAFGGSSIRSIAALYPEVLHLLVATNSTIRALGDLVGKRVGIGPAGSGTEQIVTNLLVFAGMADKTMPSHAPFQTAIRKLNQGELDAAFFLAGLGAPVIDEALQSRGLSLIPVSMQPNDSTVAPEVQARQFAQGLRVRYPHVSAHTIPLMAYGGLPLRPIPSVGVQAVLACRHDVAPEIIEVITRTLFAQRAVLSQKEPSFIYLEEQAAQSGLQFPLHAGAEDFYRRREPGFLARHAEIIGLILSLALLAWSILVWARRWYLQRQKNRIDTYYEAVEDVIRRLHDGTDLQEIEELEAELLKIRQRASAELVAEQLAADESFIIYQNMLNGCQAMLVRMRERIKESPDGGKSANLTP
ncbi:MAG: TAXI family TRAP transporter solute-binding subunit [Verrucomicrobiota bacterium]|nr:TAXI family TRAP transporter solute-binding subunit [Verrucomicrobiota bacterium]